MTCAPVDNASALTTDARLSGAYTLLLVRLESTMIDSRTWGQGRLRHFIVGGGGVRNMSVA